MAMTVRYNASANRALNHADKNDKVRSKALGKIASGMKINSAGDDAANFSIGARMRVKLRALEQDTQNVQNGSAILNTAEGGIQRQIDLIRTIRAKVIDAANDSNTDEDRQTIQKELYHLYTQMENIAYETDYNSKKPLLADTLITLTEGGASGINATKLNLIRDAQYEMLDNVKGPFATFDEYSSGTTEILGTASGYVAGTSSTTSTVGTIDFSNFSSVEQLKDRGIIVNGTRYVFTDDINKNYYNGGNKILLADTLDKTIDNFVNKFSGYNATRDGMKVQMNKSISKANNTTGSNVTYDPGQNTVTVSSTPLVTKSIAKAGISGTTSGGFDNGGDPDWGENSKATLTVNLSSAAINSGFQFNGTYFRINPETQEGEPTAQTLIKGTPSEGETSSFNYTFDGTNLTFTAKNYGDIKTSIYDGYTYSTQGEPTTNTYAAYTDFSGDINNDTTTTPGTSATPATYELDLSGMSVEDFSDKFAGKIFQFNGGTRYKFHDSGREPQLESFEEDSGSRNDKVTRIPIDIDDIRQAVNGGTSLASAVASKLGVSTNGDSVKFTAYSNSAQATLTAETLRHYDIDFSNLKVKIPNGLYGKGFRAYCATDNKEWFNFVFTNGTDAYDTDKDNIKSININVSGVSNVTDLLQTICTQGNALLTSGDPKFNHHMRLAADIANNTLTLYDHRRFSVSHYPNLQEQGAKIADGISLTEEEPIEKERFVRDLVIQHTDKAGMNIHIQIPHMTLDKIFDPLPINPTTIFDYPVTSKESRNYLLGNPNPPGILDNGLKYLLDAATLVGAQNRRLEFTAGNITTEIENLTASESVITDADMAKEMTEYTKANVLSQAAQAMLAQARACW